MSNIFRTALLGLATAVSLLGCSATTQTASPLATGTQGVARNVAKPDVSRAAISQGIYEVVYSGKQGLLFVASAGSFTDDTVPYRVLVVDPESLAVVETMTLPYRAFSLALDDEGDRLYVGNTSQGVVTVIDTRTRRVLDEYQVVKLTKGKDGRERPEYHFRQLVLDTKNHRLYMPVFDNTKSELYVIDTRTGKLEAAIPDFGYTATGIALDEQGKRLYVSNMEGDAIVVDTDSNEIVKRFSLGVEQPLNLAYDSVNHRLLAVDQGHPKMVSFQKRGIPGYESKHPGHRVIAIDLNTEQPIAEFPAGGPINLKIDSKRNRLFVTNRMSGEVTVFDSKNYSKLHAISLPPHPNTPALDPGTGDLFVTVKNDEDAPKGSKESVARIRFPD